MSSPRDATEPRPSASRYDWPVFAIEYVIESDGGSDRCTLHPRDASAEALLDAWITAAEGSFVSVTRTR